MVFLVKNEILKLELNLILKFNMSSSSDIETGNYTLIHPEENSLENKETRQKFIRRVFSLVTFQLGVNLFCICMSMQFEEISNFLKSEGGIAILYILEIMVLFLVCCSLCIPTLLKSYPINILFYSFLTLSFSYILSVVCVLTDPTTVFQAMCGTFIITGALTLFAMQTKYDFTPLSGILFTCLIIIIFASVLNFYFGINFVNIIIIVCSLILFMLYLIIDIQMIVGGDHTWYKFTEEDYILAAMCLYLDIINIFIRLLQLIEACKDVN